MLKMNFITCKLRVKEFLPLLGNFLFYEELHVSIFFKKKSYIGYDFNETRNLPHKTHWTLSIFNPQLLAGAFHFVNIPN
jgi:hypothetical protein